MKLLIKRFNINPDTAIYIDDNAKQSYRAERNGDTYDSFYISGTLEEN